MHFCLLDFNKLLLLCKSLISNFCFLVLRQSSHQDWQTVLLPLYFINHLCLLNENFCHFEGVLCAKTISILPVLDCFLKYRNAVFVWQDYLANNCPNKTKYDKPNRSNLMYQTCFIYSERICLLAQSTYRYLYCPQLETNHYYQSGTALILIWIYFSGLWETF